MIKLYMGGMVSPSRGRPAKQRPPRCRDLPRAPATRATARNRRRRHRPNFLEPEDGPEHSTIDIHHQRWPPRIRPGTRGCSNSISCNDMPLASHKVADQDEETGIASSTKLSLPRASACAEITPGSGAFDQMKIRAPPMPAQKSIGSLAEPGVRGKEADQHQVFDDPGPPEVRRPKKVHRQITQWMIPVCKRLPAKHCRGTARAERSNANTTVMNSRGPDGPQSGWKVHFQRRPRAGVCPWSPNPSDA